MTRDDARTILRGIIPQGASLKSLPAEGRREVTEAVDAVLRLAERKP